jgi:DNA-binding LacI/PurR family transcriptional regulator
VKGERNKGSMAVGIKEIGERLQLSPSTVSRALNDKRALNAKGVPYISDATMARVLEASKEMGYRPNHVARSLALGKTMRIAFWIPTITSRFFQEITSKFHDYLKTIRYEIIQCEFNEDMLSLTSPLGLGRADVDGAILYGGDTKIGSEGEWEKYASQLSIVNMGAVPYKGPLDYLQIDAYSAVVEALEHLLKTNRNKIVHVLDSGRNTMWDGDPRYRAYNDVLKKAGKTPKFLEIDTGECHRESAHKSVCEYLKTNKCPDAFFCAEDEFAIGVYRGLRDLGLKIPDDVAIVGFDGIVDTEYIDPRISTIVQPMDEICDAAWKLLSRRMEKKNLPRQESSVNAIFRLRGSSQSSD